MSEQPTLQDFIEAWPIFADAIWASILAGMTLGTLGVYIILGRMVFLTASMSQVASLGVAFTYLLQSILGGIALSISPTVGSLVFVVICLAFALRFDEKNRRDRDAVLGILFVSGSSGTLIIAGIIPQEMADIQTLLFGSAVAVLPEDLLLVGVSALLIMGVQAIGWRGFIEMILDPITAKVRGLPLPVLQGLLVGSLALMVATATRTLGALPTFSFTVLPAMISIKWSSNVSRAMVLAGLIGVNMGLFGYYIAFVYGFPVGASQTLAGLMFLLVSTCLLPLKGFVSSAAVEASSVLSTVSEAHQHHTPQVEVPSSAANEQETNE